jgi:hypothetical protein
LKKKSESIVDATKEIIKEEKKWREKQKRN